MTSLEVVAVGLATTIQDGGRPGYAAIGVSASGAVDRRAHALVNRLVGNPEQAAALETAGGLVLRATGPCVVASSAESAPRALAPGERLTVAPASGRLWGYLAVRGGLAVLEVLGSASQDTLSGLGPSPLTTGQRLAIGADPGTPMVVDQAPGVVGADAVPVWPGPRLDWFAPHALRELVTTAWTVADVSRIGVRLDGPPIRRAVHDELPSEGLVTGAVQVPPDGRPVIMLADHPTTGGYPVIAVVDPAAVGAAAQVPPGSAIRFRAIL